MSKLERQLAGASRETILLTAELLYLQVLPLSNVSAATKIARIEKVLSWAPGTKAELPEELRHGLQSEGAFNGGVGFNIQVADHVAWLSRFVEYAASQPQSLINSALADPWEFVGLTQSVPHDWPTIRYSIDFLAWPDHLQPVVSKDHRIKIRNAFAGIIGGQPVIPRLTLPRTCSPSGKHSRATRMSSSNGMTNRTLASGSRRIIRGDGPGWFARIRAALG